jgi:DNA-binding NarL/FixJ family response regulator
MKKEDIIRVVLFDDNDTFRDSITMLLEDADEIILSGSFPDCRNVIEDIRNCHPDVVIMDIDMPGINGIEAVKLIRRHFPGVQVLMQTVFDNDEKVFAALKAGAVGYILKNSASGQLLRFLKEVHTGGAPMSPSVARKLLLHFHAGGKEQAKWDVNLSLREKEVLDQLVQGLSYKMIAARLNITYDTVRAHMKKIYYKLHVSSMTGAVALAIINGGVTL